MSELRIKNRRESDLHSCLVTWAVTNKAQKKILRLQLFYMTVFTWDEYMYVAGLANQNLRYFGTRIRNMPIQYRARQNTVNWDIGIL